MPASANCCARSGQIAPRLGLELFAELDLLEEGAPGALLDDPAALDALLTLGGDGTLLRGARFLQAQPGADPRREPRAARLPHRLPADQFESALTRFAHGDYTVETRMALEAVVLDPSGAPRQDWYALNDVVLHKGGFARVVTLRVAANERDHRQLCRRRRRDLARRPAPRRTRCRRAGRSSSRRSRRSLVTPVSAHTLAIRPLVLPPTAVVSVQSEGGPEEIAGHGGRAGRARRSPSARRSPYSAPRTASASCAFRAAASSTRCGRSLGWGGLPQRDQPPAC